MSAKPKQSAAYPELPDRLKQALSAPIMSELSEYLSRVRTHELELMAKTPAAAGPDGIRYAQGRVNSIGDLIAKLKK